MNEKFCPVCLKTKPLEKFQLNPDGSIRKHVCKACNGMKYRYKLKLEMLEAFGWKCQCCGEDNPHFLTMDHVMNDGRQHREEVGGFQSVEVLYGAARKEGWPKDKYQLLCMNCNWAKGKWGECPHKSGKTAQDVIAEMKAKVFYFGKQYQNHNLEGLKLGPTAPRAPKTRTVDINHMLDNLSQEDLAKLLAKFGSA